MTKRKKMTLAESKKHAKQVDSYIKRTTPRVQEQLEHLIDAGLRIHEPDYTPALVKGRIDSQPRDGSVRDYFLDGNIFLSVELPSMDFMDVGKSKHSVINMSFRMFGKDGEPVDDNEFSVKGRVFDPLFDYSLVVKLITRLTNKKRPGGMHYVLLDSKDFIWCSNIDWYKINGEILGMTDYDMDYFCVYVGDVSTVATRFIESIYKEKVNQLMIDIMFGDLFPCFFKEVNNAH